MADEELDAGSPLGLTPTAPQAAPAAPSIMQRIQNSLGVADNTRVPYNVNPNESYPDTEYDAQARAITEHYQAEQSLKEASMRAERTVVPRDQNRQLGAELARNFANFMFHDEMSAMGVDWNRDHINWSLDNARDFWSDHPFRAGLAVLTTGAPMLAEARRLTTMAHGVEAGIDAAPLVEAGLVDSLEHYNSLDAGAKKIVQDQASRIADIAELKGKIANGTATPVEKMKAMFNTAFGNSYLDTQAMENMNPAGTLKAWQDRMEDITTGRATQGLLQLAEDVPKSEHTQILHALKDPSQMKGLSQAGKLFILAYGPEGRRLQSEMLKEGMIDQDTYNKVGNIWFSTVRKGSPIAEAGPTTQGYSAVLRRGEGDPLKVINVPRTASPNLMERQLDSAGVTSLIKRQRASELLAAGKEDKAMSLLKQSTDPEDAKALELIKSGRHDEAQGIMGKDGFLESDPKQLVINSMLQQKLLFENFRTLREVATNPDLVRTYDEVQAMSAGVRNRMIPLSRMENSHILSRMVATKLGKTVAPPLGYVHESLFNALVDATNRNVIKSGVGLLDIGTAILKSMKVSGNPLAHIHHSVGDMVFMHMAGFNPLDPENMALLGKSFTAVKDWNVARSGGAAMHEIKDLGMLESKVGGPAIDIAKELQNPLLSGDHGILDTASMESAEGIPMLAKLFSQAGDTQYLAKGLINIAQKTSKITGLDKASKIYMGENALFKFGYFLHLRQRGLNPLAATNEVCRRMPMYGTVGQTIQRSRRMLLPWMSFPTEATRIIKNNMMDYPFRTAMWLHAPNMVQGSAAALSGMDYDEIQAIKEQNPMWAQKIQSVTTGIKDHNGDVRSFMLDMLPMSNIYPQSIAKNAPLRQQLPMGLGDPAPIITGFIEAMQGKDAFGQDIPVDPNSMSAKVLASLSATIGLMTPPWIQKYMFNPEQPGFEREMTPGGYGLPGYRAGQDFGQLKNPSTGKTGDPIFDGILTNTMIRNYAASPETEIGNQRYGQRESQNYRGRLGREFAAWTTSGHWDQASQVMRDVYMSFLSETPDNPALARQNYGDWINQHARDIMKAPQLKGLSKSDFQQLISKVTNSSAPVIAQAQQDYIDALRRGYVQSGAQRGYRNSNPLTRGPRDVSTGLSPGL